MANSAIAERERSATVSHENGRTEQGHEATAAIAMALMSGNQVLMLEMRLCIGPHAVRPCDLPQHIGPEEAERQIDYAIESMIALLYRWNGVPNEHEALAAAFAARARLGEVRQ